MERVERSPKGCAKRRELPALGRVPDMPAWNPVPQARRHVPRGFRPIFKGLRWISGRFPWISGHFRPIFGLQLHVLARFFEFQAVPKSELRLKKSRRVYGRSFGVLERV